jgi:hypothetical protein
MRRAIAFVSRACEGPQKNQIDAEKINHTQPCSLQRWSGLLRPVFFARWRFALRVVQVCKQKVRSLSLTLLGAAVKLNLPYRP